MINNKDLQQAINNIENKKNKYYLIGFILGIMPYLFIIMFAKLINVSSSFINILIVFAIITAFANAHILSNQIFKRLIEFFNIKYNINYLDLKKEHF